MPTDPVVQARHVSKSFGEVRVLDDVHFDIRRGEMVGLIGASGSGKSTLIRAIAGLTPIDCAPDGGEIRLFSQPMQQRGRIAPGLRADLVLVDPTLPGRPRVVAVLVGGRIVHLTETGRLAN